MNENKSWKRTDAPEDAWDIDKERDATMYKRESLERLLSLTPSEAKPDKTVVCNKCRAPVSKRSLETQKDRAHLHRLYYADKYVAVGIYERDGTTVAVLFEHQARRRRTCCVSHLLGRGRAHEIGRAHV